MLRAILQVSRRRKWVSCARTRAGHAIREPKLLFVLIKEIQKDKNEEIRQLQIDKDLLHKECRKEISEVQEKRFAEWKLLHLEFTKTESKLKDMSTKYLQATSSMNMRSVMEMYRDNYIGRDKHGYYIKWGVYINNPNSESARLLKQELTEAKMDITNIDGFVKDLYSAMSYEIHKAVKSNSKLYILCDKFTENQLTFLKFIAKCVIHPPDLIQEITTEQWEKIHEPEPTAQKEDADLETSETCPKHKKKSEDDTCNGVADKEANLGEDTSYEEGNKAEKILRNEHQDQFNQEGK